MARNSSTILGTTNPSYNQFHDAPMVNLAIGGQHGHQSDLRFFHANTDYVRRNVVAKLIEAPAGFNLHPQGQEFINALKGIVELHAQTWEGLNKTLTVNSTETPVSGAGEMQQTPSNVVRARSTPSLTMPEKYGMPTMALFDWWITQLIMDPDSKVPGILTNSNLAGVGFSKPTDLLPDFYSMTVLFFEPDPTFSKVQRAWLVGNMYPNTAGEDTGRRDKTQDGETVSLSIEFSGIQQVGLGVNRFAQGILDSMNLTGTNPNLAPSFVSQISSDVLASAYGYSEKLSEAASSFITP